jgi:hypothetical protein
MIIVMAPHEIPDNSKLALHGVFGNMHFRLLCGNLKLLAEELISDESHSAIAERVPQPFIRNAPHHCLRLRCNFFAFI